MDDPSAPAIRPDRHRWPAILLVVLLVPISVLAFLWLAIPPRVPTGPIRLVRADSGQLAPADSSEPPSFGLFEMHAGTIAANNSFSSCSTASRSDHSGFACRRLVIVNRSDHLLMARVGPLLLDELKSLGYIRQLDYYPVGFHPEQGQLAPDVTITIDLDKLTESDWLVSHSVDATFTVSAGNGPPGCRNSYTDHLSPPVVQFDWNGTLHHVSRMTGIRSSAAKYKLVAQDVAKQIAGSLTKEFNDRRNKEGLMPDLPQAFYPAYRKPPALPLKEFGNLELVASWHALMHHNETRWRLTPDRPATEVLDGAQHRLEAAGWKTQDASKPPAQSYLRMSRNGAVLTMYAASPLEMQPDSSPRASILDIQYVDRMTQGELRAAIDELLVQGASTEVLICFERQWSEDQSRRVLKSLQSRPARTPQTALTLASLYHRLKLDDKARGELVHASALLRTVVQYSDLENKIRSLAKELGDEKLAEKPVEPRVLEELGFIELKAGIQVAAQPIGPEEPVHFYVKTPGGSLKTISLWVVEKIPDKGERSYGLAWVESSKNMRSWSTAGTSLSSSVDDRCSASFALERPDSAGRLRLNTQLSGR